LGLREALRGRRVAVDTVAFIYLIEEHPKYWPLVRSLFEDADKGKREIVTSALTLLEVLVIPYRVGDLALAERYEAVLTQSRGVHLVDVPNAGCSAGGCGIVTTLHYAHHKRPPSASDPRPRYSATR